MRRRHRRPTTDIRQGVPEQHRPCAFGVTTCRDGRDRVRGQRRPGPDVQRRRRQLQRHDRRRRDGHGRARRAAPPTSDPVRGGTIQCAGGSSSCVGAIEPVGQRSCNGADDDCDGPSTTTSLASARSADQSNTAPCSFGSMRCQNGATLCVGAVNPTAEICDGVDDLYRNGVVDATRRAPASRAAPGTPSRAPSGPCSTGGPPCVGNVDPQTGGVRRGQPTTATGHHRPTPASAARSRQSNGAQRSARSSAAARQRSSGAVNPSPDVQRPGRRLQRHRRQQPGGLGTQCGVSNVGLCKFGVNQCQNGALVCVGAVSPAARRATASTTTATAPSTTTPGRGRCAARPTSSKQCQSGTSSASAPSNPKGRDVQRVDDAAGDGAIDKTAGAEPPRICRRPANIPSRLRLACDDAACMRRHLAACVRGTGRACCGSRRPLGPHRRVRRRRDSSGDVPARHPAQPPVTDGRNNSAARGGSNCYAGAPAAIWGAAYAGAMPVPWPPAGRYYDPQLATPGGRKYARHASSPRPKVCNGVDDNCKRPDRRERRTLPLAGCGVCGKPALGAHA